MKTIMKLKELKTIEQLTQFLDGTQAVVFSLNSSKNEHYKWFRRELIRFRYLSFGKADKGVFICYLIKVSSYSQSQITRLIKQYRITGNIKYRHVASLKSIESDPNGTYLRCFRLFFSNHHGMSVSCNVGWR
jgi:hypothetical protein